jgi:predicted acyltransferase
MKSERLFSLDLLRGLDMILLVVVGPMFWAVDSAWHLPDCVMGQFHHNWGGFTLWDLIMPLFIFMCGSAVPFALEKRKTDGRAGLPYWRHVLARVAVLWILGMIAQGRLLSMDILLINPFNNTLQAIASGYLVAAAVLAIPSKRVRIAAPFVLAAVYTAFLHFGGDYTMNGNAATRFERWLLPLITPNGSKALALADPGYSWWATIPMFGAMTLCGMAATNILMDASAPQTKRLARLVLLGAALLAFGWAVSPWIPAIKHIYTLSFTAQAMGWCMLLLAALYFAADVLHLRRGTGLVLLFGQTSLMAYMCHEFKTVFRAFGKMLAPGAAHLFGPSAEPVAVWLAATALLVLFLALWRWRKAAPEAHRPD